MVLLARILFDGGLWRRILFDRILSEKRMDIHIDPLSTPFKAIKHHDRTTGLHQLLHVPHLFHTPKVPHMETKMHPYKRFFQVIASSST